MTPAVPSLPDASRRLQAALALASLVAAAAITVVLVATPVASRPAGTAGRTGSLPQRPRIEIRGADGFAAYALADRLAAEGATMEGVQPTEGTSETSGVTIVYYDRRHASTAGRIREILGRGTVRREQVFEPKADVTIMLGKDR